MPFDRSEEGVVTERPEPERECFEITVTQLLIWERQHFVIKPRISDGSNVGIIELAQICTVHGCAARCAARDDSNASSGFHQRLPRDIRSAILFGIPFGKWRLRRSAPLRVRCARSFMSDSQMQLAPQELASAEKATVGRSSSSPLLSTMSLEKPGANDTVVYLTRAETKERGRRPQVRDTLCLLSRPPGPS